MGGLKQPCCIGSADGNSKNASKPICEECGLGCYSELVAQGIKGNWFIINSSSQLNLISDCSVSQIHSSFGI